MCSNCKVACFCNLKDSIYVFEHLTNNFLKHHVANFCVCSLCVCLPAAHHVRERECVCGLTAGVCEDRVCVRLCVRVCARARARLLGCVSTDPRAALALQSLV